MSLHVHVSTENIISANLNRLKMKASSTTPILQLAIAICVAVLCNANPVDKRQSWMGGTVRSHAEEECIPLNDRVQAICGYNKTFIKFPHLGKNNLEELYNEFYDWEPLIKTNCSDQVTIFFCTHYFPFSSCKAGVPLRAVKPCKEACIAVKENTLCTKLVGIATGDKCPWRSITHLDCDGLLNADPKNMKCSLAPSTSDDNTNSGDGPVSDEIETAMEFEIDCSADEPGPPGTIHIPESNQKGRCYKLPENIANFCNYNNTFIDFSDHRGIGLKHPNMDSLVGQFMEWVPLLDTGCSDHLGTLLCFHYFPFAPCDPDSTPTGMVPTVVPCRDTCEVAKTEQCVSNITRLLCGDGFASHLECSLFPHSNGLCMSSSTPRTRNTFNVPAVPVTRICPTIAAETEPEKVIATETEPECPKKCKLRTKATRGTLKNERNLHYAYAVKVTVLSISDDSLEVKIDRNPPLSTCVDGTLLGPANFNETVVVVLECTTVSTFFPNVTVGSMYWISGPHECFDENDTIEIGCEDNALISPWETKYTKSMDRWVAQANEHRMETCVPSTA